MKNKTKIIFDTNFLFVTFVFKIDVIRELERIFSNSYEIYIYESTIRELENLKKVKSKDRKIIPLIYTFIKKYGLKVIESEKTYTDKVILENLDENYVIATNDFDLRRKIKKENENINFLVLRKKQYLILI